MIETGRKVWWAAFGVFGLLGITWALSIAPMGAPDEIAHSRRAVAVARGQFLGETVWVDTPSLRAPQTEVQIPQGYGQGFAIGNDQTLCWSNDLRVPTSCAPRPASESGPIARTVTYVGAYQPGYYFVVGLPSRWLPPSTGIYAMRIVSALLVAVLLASAAVSVGELGSGPWRVVGAAAALTPTVLFLGGSINPNGFEIAASAALWTSLLVLLRSDGPSPSRLLVRVGVAAVALACTRPTSPMLLVAIVVAALAFGATRARVQELWPSRRVRTLVGVVGAALVVNLGFVIVNQSLSKVIQFKVPERSRLSLARAAVDQSPSWLDQALGSLTWLGRGAVRLPPGVRWLWWGAIVLVLVVGLARATMRQRLVLVLLAAACAVGPIAASVLEPAALWQGRYMLPLLVGIPLLAGLASDRARRPATGERWLASAVVTVIAGCQVAAHQHLMVRNLLGLPAGLLRGILHAPWTGPLSPLILLGLAAAGSAGFLALCLAGIWHAAPVLVHAPEVEAPPEGDVEPRVAPVS